MSPTNNKQRNCALSYQQPCCQGKGYIVQAEGGLARAARCECVLRCPLCVGSNLLVVDGVSRPCKQPSPGAVITRLNRASIPARFAQASLDNFTNLKGDMKQHLKTLRGWLKDFKPASSQGLVLSGPVGLGKTHLLIALTKELIAKGINVKFVDFFQLLSILRDGFASDRSELSTLEPLMAVDVLAIDEIGKGRNSDWEKNILDQLIMGRYNRNRTVIASTNYRLTLPETVKRGSFNVPLDTGEDRARPLNTAPKNYAHWLAIAPIHVWWKLPIFMNYTATIFVNCNEVTCLTTLLVIRPQRYAGTLALCGLD